MTTQETLLTIPEAAERLRVPESWFYYATRKGQFPCVRIGRHIRIRESDIDNWIATGGKAGGDE